MQTMIFFSPYLIPLSMLAGYATGELSLFKLVAWVWLAVAALDFLIDQLGEASQERQTERSNRGFLTWLALGLWVPAQAMTLSCGLLITRWESPTFIELAFVTVSIGVTSGMFCISAAHELMHRTGRLNKVLAEILMTSVSYTHFCIEHVRGHHCHVGTPKDPATARFGESFYEFYPRTIFGGLLDAWNHEAARLYRRGQRSWGPGNRMIRYAANLIVLYVVVGYGFGALGAVFLAGQSLIAFSLLEVINYVQHYGLARRELAPGRYEPVMPWHSWNSSHRFSNWLLFNLGLHSDHHYRPNKLYSHLRGRVDAPQLPGGYFAMFLLPFFPGLWRRVMDPRVRAWRETHGFSPDSVTTTPEPGRFHRSSKMPEETQLCRSQEEDQHENLSLLHERRC
jgi:alkane 1-monooxygenase